MYLFQIFHYSFLFSSLWYNCRAMNSNSHRIHSTSTMDCYLFHIHHPDSGILEVLEEVVRGSSFIPATAVNLIATLSCLSLFTKAKQVNSWYFASHLSHSYCCFVFASFLQTITFFEASCLLFPIFCFQFTVSYITA